MWYKINYNIINLGEVSKILFTSNIDNDVKKQGFVVSIKSFYKDGSCIVSYFKTFEEAKEELNKLYEALNLGEKEK